MNLKELVEYYLPHLVVAGDYTLQIQKRVKSQAAKTEGATPFSQALTDADITVQGYIEVVTLAKYPELAFDPEEADHSLNLKYFDKDAAYTLTLDPVNGTAFYKDGLPIYDIIITVVRGGKIAAAVTYLPAKGEFYIGIEGVGAFKTDRLAVARNEPWQPLRLDAEVDLVMTYRCPAEVERGLRRSMKVRDLQKEYDPAAWNPSINSLLTGGTCAFVKIDAQIIDWGAIAFIAELAGGKVTDFQGQPIPNYHDFPRKRIPNIIAAVNAEVHGRILGAVADSIKSGK